MISKILRRQTVGGGTPGRARRGIRRLFSGALSLMMVGYLLLGAGSAPAWAASWNQLTASLSSINAVTFTGGTLYAGTSNGVYSYNTGTGTWSALSGAPSNVQGLTADSSGNLYAGTSAGTVYSESGGTWTALPAALPAAVTALTYGGSTLYAATNSDVYTYGGGTWTALSGSPSTVDALAVVGSVLYAGIQSSPSGAYSYSNGTWTLMSGSPAYVFSLTDAGGLLAAYAFNGSVNVVWIYAGGSWTQWSDAPFDQDEYVFLAYDSTAQVFYAADQVSDHLFVSIVPPTVTSVSPSSGRVGTTITVDGSRFGAEASTSGDAVYFQDSANHVVTQVGPAATWSSGVVSTTVPSGLAGGAVSIAVYSDTNGLSSYLPSAFTLLIPVVQTATLPSGVVGSSYSSTLSATGGLAPYTWSVTGGSLPAGLSLSSAGVISGTPTASGTDNFTVQVTDSDAATATANLSIRVVTPLSVGTTSLPSVTEGSSYSATLSASGGTAPYTWSVTSGSLPAGLSLSSAGVISGTPTASGTDNFTVQVKDADSLTATANLSIVVTPPPTVITNSLAAGSAGASYSATLAATGGTAPYTWSITSGSLPSGLSLSSGGVISGTPSTWGTQSFTVQVTDSTTPTPLTSTASLSLTVGATIQVPSQCSLVAAMQAAQDNNASNECGAGAMNGPYTIVLDPGQGPYVLSAANNYVDGPNGLPDVTQTVTVESSSSTPAVIERSTAFGTVPFRIFHVSAQAAQGASTALGTAVPGVPGVTQVGSLTLKDVELENGAAWGGVGEDGGGGGLGAGGAIFSHGGDVTIDNSTLAYNGAQGGYAQAAGAGGGGGGMGGVGAGSGGFGGGGGGGEGGGYGGGGAYGFGGAYGGNGGFGGGGGGSDRSGGGDGGYGGGYGTAGSDDSGSGLGGGGAGMGGAIFALGGSLSLTSVTFQNNGATGGQTLDHIAPFGSGYGGAVFIDAINNGVTVYDSSGLTFSGDTASTSTPDVYTYGATTPAQQSQTITAGPTSGSPVTVSVPGSGGGTGAAAAVVGLTGTVNVAEYDGNPAPGASAVAFQSGSASYADVELSNATGTSSPSANLTVSLCQGVSSGQQMYWLNGSTWEAVSPAASYDSASGCLVATLTSTSSPSLSQLTGTAFAAALPVVVASSGYEGGGGLPTPPQVSGISPSTGPAAGGTSVEITGTAFTGVTGVSFGPNADLQYTVQSPTAIEAVSPAGTGTVNITVTTGAGTSATGPADEFTYQSAPPATAVPPAAFTDVPSTYWASGSIDSLAAHGIVNGYDDGTFRPDQPVSRAEFVKMLVLTLGLKPSTASTPFGDVGSATWFAPYVSAAFQAGLVQGLTPISFDPNQMLTREQMAVLVARALKLTQIMTLHFSDDAQIAPWATTGVQEAVAAGYISGFPGGDLQPLGAATRAQAAKVLASILQHT